MRESANLACYAIVYAKGMVPKDKLDQAMMTSVSEGAPLEQVLVKSNALKPGAVDDLIKARNRLGRHCVKCGEQTFLLQDQNESNTKCEDEKCGGKLLTTAEWAARQKPLPNLRPVGTPVHGVKVGDGGGAALEGRIARLEAALKALEEKAGKPDPGALARAAEHAEKVLAPRLEAARKEAAMAIREAASAKEASERASQVAGAATASVAEGLGVSDLADLPGHLAETLTPRVVQAVRGRLDELSGLGDRVAALEAGAGERGGGGGVDPTVVAAQVTSAVAAQVTESLEGRLADLEKRVATADGWAEKVAAGLKKIPDEQKLIEKAAEKVKATLPPPAPPLDAEELVERTSRAVLSSVDERLAQGVAEAQAAAQSAAQTSAREAVRPLEARLMELEARPTGAPGVEERLAEVEARADREELALGKRLTQLEESLATAAASAAAKPGGVDDAALEARLAGVEERIGAAQADVLEALNGRVEELARSIDGLPAKAVKDAVAAVKDRLEQLDDPRELMGRAATQATKDALAAVEKRLEKLGQAGPAPAAAAPAGGAARADLDKLQAGLDELKETIDLLQARMDAQRARQQGPSADELVARVQEGVLATVGERMVALEARLAETTGNAARSTTSDASVSGEGAGPNADAVVQQAVQAVWDQLDPLDLPGLPQRMTELVTKSVLAQIDENLAGLPDRLAASAAAPVMASIEARITKLDLKNLPKKIAADVKAELGQSGGGGEPVDEAGLTARILEQVDQRLADRPAPPAAEGGGVDLDQVREVAREVAAEVVAERQAGGGGAASSGNGDGGGGEGGGGDGGKTEKRLAAMARALKELKDDFDGVKEQVGTLADRPPVGEAAPAAGPVPRELIAFLNSVEFKEVFDKRINEVLRYVKNDLVPSAVKKAVDAASAAGSS